ncbi:MAG TPA: hypothetical protein VGK34_07605 [Armatimonadota bacterium]
MADAERLTVSVAEIISRDMALFQGRLTDSDATALGDVDLIHVLDDPACVQELSVNLFACVLFGR